MMVEWRPKHVDANKCEKKRCTTGAFVGLFFNNLKILIFVHDKTNNKSHTKSWSKNSKRYEPIRAVWNSLAWATVGYHLHSAESLENPEP